MVLGCDMWDRSNVAQQNSAFTKFAGLVSVNANVVDDSPGKAKTPLERYFERELGLCKSVLQMLRRDLEDLKLVAEGEMKSTNRSRELLAAVAKGEVPAMWKKYAVPELPINSWIADFVLRVEQTTRVAEVVMQGAKDGVPGLPDPIWMGGFFGAVAFLTATQQTAAAALGAALEQLEMVVDILDEGAQQHTEGAPTGTQYLVTGSFLEGATWRDGALGTSDDMITRLPLVRLTWVKQGDPVDGTRVELPVYLNLTRKNLVTTARLKSPEGMASTTWYQRGACILLWRQI